MKVWLVTITDYETDTLIGVYSTESKAQAAASSIDIDQYGRFGPYVFPVEVDETSPIWLDGERRDLAR